MTVSKGPDFIGIGMERCGTSWLYTMLAAHPEIWVPPIKELHYFDRIEKGFSRDKSRFRRHLISRIRHRAALIKDFSDRPELYKNEWLDDLYWDFLYFTGRKSDAWYQRLFQKRFTKGRVAGEVTPAYANISEGIIKGLVAGLPHTKFILLLRDPFERFKSGLIHHFKVEQGRQLYTVLPENMIAYVQGADVRERSSPSHVLSKWTKHVPSDNLFIGVQADELDTDGFLNEVYGFLDVGQTFRPNDALINKKINAHSKMEDEQYIPDEVIALMQNFAHEEQKRLKKQYPEIAKIWAG